MLNNKKGAFIIDDALIWIFALLLSSPWILLGIAVFIIVIYLMTYFMLGKLLGAVMIFAAIFMYFRTKSWIVAFGMIAIGLMMFLNPLGWETLQMMRW